MSVTRTKQPAGPKGDKGNRVIQVVLFGTNDIIVAGSSLAMVRINVEFDGWFVSKVAMCVFDDTDGAPVIIDIRNESTDILTQPLTLASGEFDTLGAATPPIINGASATVHEADRLFFDVTQAGSNAYGCNVEVTLANS